MGERSHATGWGPESPSPAQLTEFFSQIRDKRITHGILQQFLNRKKIITSIPKRLTTGERKAINLLGNKVITAADVLNRWGVHTGICQLPDTEDTFHTIEECAQQNSEGTTDWHLMYILGLSLQDQLDYLNIIGGNQHRFFNCLPDKKQNYFSEIFTPGYYLFNLRLIYMGVKWEKQELLIHENHCDSQRCDERMLSEALLSLFMTRYVFYPLHWGGESRGSYCCHLGRGLDHRGGRVTLSSKDGHNTFYYVDMGSYQGGVVLVKLL
jgi:hypothetical protein